MNYKHKNLYSTLRAHIKKLCVMERACNPSAGGRGGDRKILRAQCSANLAKLAGSRLGTDLVS